MAVDRAETLRNLLIGALTPDDMAALAPHMKLIDLVVGERLSPAGRTIRYGYFPISGMISLVHRYVDGATIEVGLIGREGFCGAPLILDAASSPIEAMVQGSGQALRIPGKALIATTNSRPKLRSQLLRHVHFLQVQLALTASCNGLHKIEPRLARWLLEAHDRLGGETLALKHEFLSYMLGVRRAGITEALAALKEKGLIGLGRGRIIILKRAELEADACDCYRIVKKEYRRLFDRSQS